MDKTIFDSSLTIYGHNDNHPPSASADCWIPKAVNLDPFHFSQA